MVIQTMKSIDVCLKSENCLVFNYLKMHQNIRKGSELNVGHWAGSIWAKNKTLQQSKEYANSVLLRCFCSRI